jgi:DNA repair photolyase
MFVRWDNLQVTEEEGRHLPGYRDPAVLRHFDAPEALNIHFWEVRAKSALNRVPKASQMPFRWTINPYRGCTHACTYCMSGDTLVLMADARTKALAELEVGDEVCGTVRRGVDRHFTATEVLAHWSTDKPAVRVVLEDGRELLASGDHRFLTEEGWKYVRAGELSDAVSPDLTEDDKLIGMIDVGGRPGEVPDARIRVVSIEPVEEEIPLYDITTGTSDFIANGVVSHNCFARPTHKYLDMSPGRDFEREIVVKVNVPEVLRTELARPSWKREHVAMGTNTDPYQWVEGRYKLMPEIWEALGDARTPCSILTKSPLVLRDLDILKSLQERGVPVSANLSVPTLDEKAWRATEPHTPSPRARLEAVAELNRAGIPTGVLVAPLMPGINDAPEQVERILEIATEAGAVSVGGIALHLRGEVKQIFFDWLRANRPDLVPRYEQLYRRGAYAPPGERQRLQELVKTPVRRGTRYMRGNLQREPEAEAARAAPPPPRQPSLF